MARATVAAMVLLCAAGACTQVADTSSSVPVDSIGFVTVDSTDKIFLKSKFWNTYWCNGATVSRRDLGKVYARAGDQELLSKFRLSRRITYGGMAISMTAGVGVLLYDVLTNSPLPNYLWLLVYAGCWPATAVGDHLLDETVSDYNALIDQRRAKKPEAGAQAPRFRLRFEI